MDDKYAITIKGLKKSYKNLEVLKNINLNVERGTMLALLGPNGAGKTTTVRILSTLLRPDEGDVKINGHDVVRDADAVRSIIGLTGQYAAVDEFLTAEENLYMMGKLYHLSSEDSKRRAKELIQQFDLTEAAGRMAKTYSGGMRRRLDLALSLVSTPPILFLDEPTTGLDPRSRLQMWDVIEKLKNDGATILLTTQYLEEADKLADRVAVIDHGKVIAEGTAAELKAKVGDERLEFIIARESNYDQALSIIQGKDQRHDKDERNISISTDGSVRAVKRILDELEKAKIEIDSMSVHKPTLDDVFMNLTGRGAEEAHNHK